MVELLAIMVIEDGVDDIMVDSSIVDAIELVEVIESVGEAVIESVWDIVMEAIEEAVVIEATADLAAGRPPEYWN